MNKKTLRFINFLCTIGSGIFLFLLLSSHLHAEGSKDFINYPGYRLFYAGNAQQQIKVYAAAGEFINVGASHVGITGGELRVYRPDGTLAQTYDNQGDTQGLAIIFDDIQEKNGPTGGGTTMGGGYMPGVIEVAAAEAGIWTIIMDFPNPTEFTFINLLNNQPWNRRQNQPSIQRAITAWDVTVSQNAAGNEDGELLTGRVFSNHYESVISRNGNTTSPNFLILTRDGYLYEADFKETDPWNFPLISNNLGIVNGNGEPLYTSLDTIDFSVSEDFENWEADEFYLYTPQAQNRDRFINNKIFFNTPDADMPSEALTTNIFSGNTFTTWLYSVPTQMTVEIQEFAFTGRNAVDINCPPADTANAAVVSFVVSTRGIVELRLDIDDNGSFRDSVDVTITQFAEANGDIIYWDGLDGMGQVVPITNDFALSYRMELRNGEMHVLMQDVENNLGGVTFHLLNGANTDADSLFYYDHSRLGGAVSGGGVAGKPRATTEPFVYDNNFGNDRMLDYWAYVQFRSGDRATFDADRFNTCNVDEEKDSDGDGIPDKIDLDDENDGILDILEYCQSPAFAECFATGIDPSGDEDEDGIVNYMDADDAATGLNCSDSNADGICDMLPRNIDTDGDGHPNHLDLDSDNDAILDVIEAGHFALDADGNGMIDGAADLFGANGFFNELASDPDALDAMANYQIRDKDRDAYPDFYDLDSDNDGIHDIAEASFGDLDENNNGRIDFLNIGNLGLPAVIDPVQTGVGVPNPTDTDGDNYADYHDLDSDNDGLNDVTEGGGVDLDEDGILGAGLVTVDDNGLITSDLIGIILETTSFPLHSDGDDYPDFRDRDSDNDGINDVAEILKIDPDDDGIIGAGQPAVNVNGQAFSDRVLTTSLAFNIDLDPLANYRDLDSDNDGINDVEEATAFVLDFDNNGTASFGEPEVNAFGQPGDADVALSTSIPSDWDEDGVADFLDLDVDNDGIYDTREADIFDPDNNGIAGEGMPQVNEQGQPILNENEPTVATSEPTDWDIDGVRDYRDLDSDNDGIHDVAETRQADSDHDGRVGAGQLIVDLNGVVMINEELVATTILKDTDNDLVPDWRDLDSDNDGINDVEEAGLFDADNDGFVGAGATPVNIYGQALKAGDENTFVTTSNPSDFDMDGVPDYNDLDTDNDGINDVAEASFSDPDNDGFINENIPTVNVFGQAIINPFLVIALTTSTPPDTDLDGQRDYRDLDADDDGISDVVEGENTDPDNNNQVGIGFPTVNDLGQPIGDDENVVNNTSDPVDTDEDGIADFRDPDSDDDGLLDEDECPNDTVCRDGDEDGIFDFRDRDRDNDGIDDNWECEDGGRGGTCVDTDGDGIPDVDDLDTDNDGIPDTEECAENGPCPDSDGDGVPDWRDADCDPATIPVIEANFISGFCVGDLLVLTATNNNPQGETVNYTWTGPDGFQFSAEDVPQGNFMATITNVQRANAGTYTLIVTAENGCASSPIEVEVMINETPAPPQLLVADNQVCFGQSIELSTADLGETVQYAWYRIRNTDTTLVDITPLPNLSLAGKAGNAGAYYVQAFVASAGCFSEPSESQLVNVVDFSDFSITNSTDRQNSACEGESIQLTATAYENASYEWTGGNNNFTSNEREPLLENVVAADAGRYQVRITIEGCQPFLSEPTQVFVTQDVQPQLVNLTGATCVGEQLEITVTNNLRISEGSRVAFEWYNENDELITTTNSPFLRLANITADLAEQIYLLVRVNDCEFTASEKITLDLFDPNREEAQVAKAQYFICGDEEVNLEAISPQNADGRWSTHSTATIMDADRPVTTVFDLPTGTSTFTWTLSHAKCGEFSSASVTVVKEANVEAVDDVIQTDANVTVEVDLLANDNLNQVEYTFEIIEQPNRGTVVVENGIAIYTPPSAYFGETTFTYEICNVNCPQNCSTAQVAIEVLFIQFGEDDCFLPNTITPNHDGKNDAFTVPCLATEYLDNRLTIFNRWGDQVFITEQYRNDWEGTHNGKKLPPGTYFYILQLDKNNAASIQGYFTLVR